MLFKELAGYYEKLEGVSSRLAMIDIMSELLKKAKPEEIGHVVYITQGILAPASEGIEFNMAEKTVAEAIALSTGFTKEEVEKEYKKTGDMGIAAQNIKEKSRLKRMSSKEFTVNEVYDTMRKIAATSGSGSKDAKIKLLANLVAASTPLEAKYIVKYPLDELRLGVGDSTVLEALSIVAKGDRSLKAELETAYNLNSDLGAIAEAAMKGEKATKGFGLTLFKPIRPELAERLPTAEEILERMGGKAAVDQKYDGFRVQVHKKGNRVKLFSRRLEDTTSMYPDLVEAVLREIHAESAILDGEALAYNEATNEFLPFQATIQRKRKHGLEKKIEEMPLRLFAFDLMYLNGKDMMNEPYHRRREELEKLLTDTKTIVTAGSIIAKTPKELEDYFQKSIEAGLEGIIAKDLNSTYVAGARKFSWIKLKRSYRGELSDTLDLVIVGYYLGRGMRREFNFGGLLCATYNEKKDMFETVSRIGSGFTEKQMVELRDALEKIRSKGKPARVDSLVEPDVWVIPRYIVTIRADEITKSPMHTCGREDDVGYALRFPRLVGEKEAIRRDKSIEEATTSNEVVEMYRQQKRVSLKAGER